MLERNKFQVSHGKEAKEGMCAHSRVAVSMVQPAMLTEVFQDALVGSQVR